MKKIFFIIILFIYSSCYARNWNEPSFTEEEIKKWDFEEETMLNEINKILDEQGCYYKLGKDPRPEAMLCLIDFF